MSDHDLNLIETEDVGQLRAQIEALQRELRSLKRRRDADAGSRQEQQLRLILDQVPALVWATDRDLRITSSAGAGLAALGLAPGQLVGVSLLDLEGHGMDVSSVPNHRRALAGESVVDEGEFGGRAYQARLEPLRDERGEIIGAIGVAYDITAHLEAEAELRRSNTELEHRVEERTNALAQSEAMLRVTLEQMPDLFVVYEIEGPREAHRVLLTNQITADALGYKLDELIGRPVYELQDPSTMELQKERVRRAVAGETLVYECHVRRRDGSLFPAEVRSRVFDYAGRPVLMSIARDLTTRKEAERQLRLVQSAVNQVGDAVTITSYDFEPPGPRIIYVNPAFEKMTGYSAREVIGQTPRLLQGPRTSRAVLDRVREALRRGRPFHGETYNYRKDGSEFVVEWRITPIKDEEGKITHWVAIQRDMTQARLDAELAEQHRSELAHVSRLSTMGEMASGLAHELNQPLTAITNYAQGSLRRMDSGTFTEAELREAVDRIATQAQRAGQVIQRLRQFVRKHEPRRSTTDLNQLVRDAAMLLEPDARQHRTTFHYDLDPAIPSVLCDSIQLEQVVLNLMRNAMEAMQGCPPEQRIVRAATRHDHNSVTLTVQDAGHGMPDATLHRIFDPFFTTKARGMGMGLTISRTIIEAHRGKLTAVRNPDRGMTFTITLPLPHRR